MRTIAQTSAGVRRQAAYSLLEVLIAGALIAVGIAAAALLANSAVRQQELNAIGSRAINLQEQVARLYRLGLNHSEITNRLPGPFVAASGSLTAAGTYFLTPTNSTNTVTIGGLQMEAWTNSIVYVSGFSSSGSVVLRTNTVITVRESIR